MQSQRPLQLRAGTRGGRTRSRPCAPPRRRLQARRTAPPTPAPAGTTTAPSTWSGWTERRVRLRRPGRGGAGEGGAGWACARRAWGALRVGLNDGLPWTERGGRRRAGPSSGGRGRRRRRGWIARAAADPPVGVLGPADSRRRGAACCRVGSSWRRPGAGVGRVSARGDGGVGGGEQHQCVASPRPIIAGPLWPGHLLTCSDPARGRTTPHQASAQLPGQTFKEVP
jgi:hypothetical protein